MYGLPEYKPYFSEHCVYQNNQLLLASETNVISACESFGYARKTLSQNSVLVFRVNILQSIGHC